MRRSRERARSRPAAAGRDAAAAPASPGRARGRGVRAPRVRGCASLASRSGVRAGGHPVAEQDVLGDREVRRERRLLRHGRDPVPERVDGVAERLACGPRGRSRRRRAGADPRGCSAASTCRSRSRRRARAPRRGGSRGGRPAAHARRRTASGSSPRGGSARSCRGRRRGECGRCEAAELPLEDCCGGERDVVAAGICDDLHAERQRALGARRTTATGTPARLNACV